MCFLFFQTPVDTVWNCLLSICLPPFACHGWDRQWWYMHDPLEGIWGPAGIHIDWDPPGALSCPCLHPGPPKAKGISLSRRPGWEAVLYNTFMGGGLENLWCYFTSAFTEVHSSPCLFLRYHLWTANGIIQRFWAFLNATETWCSDPKTRWYMPALWVWLLEIWWSFSIYFPIVRKCTLQ